LTLILNGTDNSATTPAVTGTDTDTGVYYPAANQVAIATSGTQAMLANASQGVQFANAIGVGATTPTTSGAGITFPATQSASSNANTLDDYEEGTWVPSNSSVTLTGVSGTYTKIGNMVTVTAQWSYPSNSSGGNAIIAGLPFAPSNDGGMNVGTTTITNYGSDNLYPFVQPGGTGVYVRNNGNTDLTCANLSAKFINFMSTYHTS
jgi:hypothetical protein